MERENHRDIYGKGDGRYYVLMALLESRKKSREERKKEKRDWFEFCSEKGIDNTGSAVFSSILGFIIGDALGVPVEFVGRDNLKNNPITDMEEYGTHNQPKGTWSDDTSMVLATMNGIINDDYLSLDYKKIMNNFLLWKDKAQFTPFNKVFDIGNATSYALSVYQQHIYDNDADNVICGTGEISSNGNGSLMRIMPIVLYLERANIDYRDEKFFEIIKTVSSMTHSHIYSIFGCYIYSVYMAELLRGTDKLEAYQILQKHLQELVKNNDKFSEVKKVYSRVINGDLLKLKEKEINSSGYVVDSLEAALWSILTSNSFEESVLKAINLGEDTDTIGALTGCLAGLIYGEYKIPEKWINALQEKDYLEQSIEEFEDYLELVQIDRLKKELNV